MVGSQWAPVFAMVLRMVSSQNRVAPTGHQSSTEYRSYRGGRSETSFVHVPNERKRDTETLLDIVEAVERGHVPALQLGHVELHGSGRD